MKKSEGMIKKVRAMIEQDKTCPEIVQQMNAAIWLLKSANATLLKNHILVCWLDILASQDKTELQPFIEEVMKVRDIGSRE